jgi:uncharacterized phiE125 gp8 family phage protein
MTVTLTQAKAQLRVTHSDEDTYITDLIARAKAWVERYIAQPIAVSTVVDTFLEFGDYLLLTRGPFAELTTIAYVDSEGEDAEIDIEATPPRVQDGRIYPPTTGWPAITTYSTITVTYTAGFETTPPEIDQAMLLLIGHWYQNREGVVVGATNETLEYAIEALAGPFRLPTIA